MIDVLEQSRVLLDKHVVHSHAQNVGPSHVVKGQGVGRQDGAVHLQRLPEGFRHHLRPPLARLHLADPRNEDEHRVAVVPGCAKGDDLGQKLQASGAT